MRDVDLERWEVLMPPKDVSIYIFAVVDITFLLFIRLGEILYGLDV